MGTARAEARHRDRRAESPEPLARHHLRHHAGRPRIPAVASPAPAPANDSFLSVPARQRPDHREEVGLQPADVRVLPNTLGALAEKVRLDLRRGRRRLPRRETCNRGLPLALVGEEQGGPARPSLHPAREAVGADHLQRRARVVVDLRGVPGAHPPQRTLGCEREPHLQGVRRDAIHVLRRPEQGTPDQRGQGPGYATKRVFNSPFMQSIWGSGKVTITYAGHGSTYDFSHRTAPTKSSALTAPGARSRRRVVASVDRCFSSGGGWPGTCSPRSVAVLFVVLGLLAARPQRPQTPARRAGEGGLRVGQRRRLRRSHRSATSEDHASKRAARSSAPREAGAPQRSATATPGVDVLTPLRLDDGRAVLVDRGFIRASPQHGVTTDPPPTVTAVVHGMRESNLICAPTASTTSSTDGSPFRVDLGRDRQDAPLPAAARMDRGAGDQSRADGQLAGAPAAAAARPGPPPRVRNRVVRVRVDPAHRLAAVSLRYRRVSEGRDERQDRKHREHASPSRAGAARAAGQAARNRPAPPGLTPSTVPASRRPRRRCPIRSAPRVRGEHLRQVAPLGHEDDEGRGGEHTVKRCSVTISYSGAPRRRAHGDEHDDRADAEKDGDDNVDDLLRQDPERLTPMLTAITACTRNASGCRATRGRGAARRHHERARDMLLSGSSPMKMTGKTAAMIARSMITRSGRPVAPSNRAGGGIR